MKSILFVLTIFSVSLTSLPQESFAQDSGTAQSDQLEKQVNQLRAEASDLERDIGLLEKELLFPPLTRVEAFLSIDSDLEVSLSSVALELDGEEKSFHIYSQRDIEALQMGGLQHFWEGNVALGQHVMIAVFKGKDAKGKPFEKTLKQKFEKQSEGLAFELQVKPDEDKQPAFDIQAWGKR